MPAGNMRAAEDIMDGRPADLTMPAQASDPRFDLPYGREIGFHVKLMQEVEEVSDRPRRSRLPLDRSHYRILQDFRVSKFVKACTSSQCPASTSRAIRRVRVSLKPSTVPI